MLHIFYTNSVKLVAQKTNNDSHSGTEGVRGCCAAEGTFPKIFQTTRQINLLYYMWINDKTYSITSS
jgi:hypothetical protein